MWQIGTKHKHEYGYAVGIASFIQPMAPGMVSPPEICCLLCLNSVIIAFCMCGRGIPEAYRRQAKWRDST